MKLGDFLLKVIFWSGMSQSEVARKCNISTPLLNGIIKINAVSMLSMLNHLKHYLECQR